jgi:hypothetical protein
LAVAELLENLRSNIREMSGLRAFHEREDGLSTGFRDFDRLLVDGGLRKGTLAEWRGEGAYALAVAVAAHRIRSEGTVVVIDEGSDFYPVAAAQIGLPLERVILVRTSEPRAALWAWEESLRSPGIAVTLGKIAAQADKVVRRLQLAVEAGGGLGFLIRPTEFAGIGVGTRICVEPLPGHEWAQRLRVRVARGQAGTASFADVELGHETSPMSVAAELARPAAKNRKRR